MGETRSPGRALRRAGLYAALTLAALAVIAATGVVALKGPGGRGLVMSFIDGRELGRLGEVSIEGLKGDVLADFRIERLTLEDEDGVWLEAEDLRIAWRPLAYLGGVVSLEALQAERVAINRRPPSGDGGDSGGGGSAPSVRLDQFSVETLELAEPVLGVAAVLTGEGAVRREDDAWRVDADIRRVDAPGDRLALQGRFGDTISLDAELDAAPDGPIAALLRAEGRGVSARAQAGGDLDAGDGAVTISIDGETAIDAAIGWSVDEITIDADARPGRWPGFERLEQLLGGPARLTARTERPIRDSVDGARVRIDAPNLDGRVAHAGGRRLELDINEAAALARAAGLDVAALESEGVLDLSGPIRFEGRAGARDLRAGPLSFATLDGPLELRWADGELSGRGDLDATGAQARPARLDQLLGDTPSLQADFIWSRADKRFALSDAALDAAAGPLRGRAAYDYGARALEMQAQSEALDLSAVDPALEGRAEAGLTLSGPVAGPLQITLDAAATDPGGALARLGDGEARLQLDGVWRDGALEAETLDLRSPALALQASGRLGPETRLSGDYAWSGGAPVDAVAVTGALAGAFEAGYADGAVDLRAQARAERLEAGPAVFDQPRLRVEAQGPPETLEGEVRFDSDSPRGRIDIAGAFSRGPDGLRLTGLGGVVADWEVSGEALIGERPRADITLTAGADRRVIARVEQGEPGVQARIEAENLTLGDLQYIDRLVITGDGPLDGLALQLEAGGVERGVFNLEGGGELALRGEQPGLTLSVSGAYAGYAVSTAEAIQVGFSGPPEGRGALRIGDGALRVDAAGGPAPRFEAELETLPVGLISAALDRPPSGGTLSGVLRFEKPEDVWLGEASLDGRELSAVDVDQTVSASASARLDREGLSASASVSGADLSGEGRLSRPGGPFASLGAIFTQDAPVSGEMRLDGQIATLAGFHTPERVSVAGLADVRATLDGTLGAPALTGEAALTEGRFSEGGLGLVLRDLTLQASLGADGGVVLDSLSAVDGQGGRVTGEGRLDFADGLSGEARLDYDGFQLANRRDLTAVGGGEAVIEIADGVVTIGGETRLDRAEAQPPQSRRPAIATLDVREVNTGAAPQPVVEESPQRGPGLEVRLDHRVVAPARVFVRGGQFETEWSLDVAASGPVSALALNGRAELLRGEANLLGRAFIFQNGAIVFDGPPDEARVTVLAARQTEDIEARVRVTGSVNDPEITLSSTPSLPQEEIISRVLFEQGAGQVGPLQAAQIGAALAAFGTGGAFDPVSSLRDAVGLDRLKVGTDEDGGTVVSGGRYIAEDVYLELEAGAIGAAPAARIEWALRDNFSLLSRVNEAAEASVALSWSVEYD